jgi:hypothetical protein
MGYTQVGLENKILEMYPEITEHGFAPMMSFDKEQDMWIVKLKKGKDEFTVRLKKKDADACMDGTYCESFGAEIRTFFKGA